MPLKLDSTHEMRTVSQIFDNAGVTDSHWRRKSGDPLRILRGSTLIALRAALGGGVKAPQHIEELSSTTEAVRLTNPELYYSLIRVIQQLSLYLSASSEDLKKNFPGVTQEQLTAHKRWLLGRALEFEQGDHANIFHADGSCIVNVDYNVVIISSPDGGDEVPLEGRLEVSVTRRS